LDSDIEDWADTEGVSALDACCICGGGNTLKPWLGSFGSQRCKDGEEIVNERLCAQAAANLGAKFALAAHWPVGHPGGCHIDTEKKTVWMNLEPMGTALDEYAPVCASVVKAKDGDDHDEEQKSKQAEKAVVAPTVPIVSSAPTGKVCMNLAGWRSKSNHSCQQYEDLQWCKPDGTYGAGWNDNGAFADWANPDGVTGKDACCACGGGKQVKVVLGAYGTQDCPGGMRIMEENVCKDAARSLGAKFESAANWPLGNPGGCHIDAGQGAVWLNTEAQGTPRDEYAPLCAMPLAAEEAHAAKAKPAAITEVAAKEKEEDKEEEIEKPPPSPASIDELRRLVSKAHRALTANLKKRTSVGSELRSMQDEMGQAADAQIDIASGAVASETNSNSTAAMLRGMWLEMRMMGHPFYEERLESEADRLEEKTPALQAAYDDAKRQLRRASGEDEYS